MSRSLGSAKLTSWDGLSLAAPVDWEPARIGRGYLLLEDRAGPTLELRWQKAQKGFSPDQSLDRLARKGRIKRTQPNPVTRAVIEALPASWRASPGGGSGQGPETLMLALPQGPAVLVGLYPRPGLAREIWPGVIASLARENPGKLALFDIRADIPEGFALGRFSFKLGHYRVEFSRGQVSLELHRLAPAEVILRGQTLSGWTKAFFAQAFGPGLTWHQDPRPGHEAVRAQTFQAPGMAVMARALAARVFSGARWVMGRAWLADQARILAVMARHGQGFSWTDFEEICGKYVLEPSQQA